MSQDEDAEFTALVERQSRFVFQVAYAVLLNSSDAEDAVQETFLKLYRNRGWQRAENERAFLARVAWRIAVGMRPRSALRESAGEEEFSSSQPGPEAVILASDAHRILHALIDSLDEELRLPLVLSAFEELGSGEIGRILSIPEGTVRGRMQRARQILRQKFAAMKEARFA